MKKCSELVDLKNWLFLKQQNCSIQNSKKSKIFWLNPVQMSYKFLGFMDRIQFLWLVWFPSKKLGVCNNMRHPVWNNKRNGKNFNIDKWTFSKTCLFIRYMRVYKYSCQWNWIYHSLDKTFKFSSWKTEFMNLQTCSDMHYGNIWHEDICCDKTFIYYKNLNLNWGGARYKKMLGPPCTGDI